MSDQYEHINYQQCPHFTVGKVDQWGESGYLIYESEIYAYRADRHEQYDTIENRMSIESFITYAKRRKIEIPERFQKEINAI